MFKRHKLIWKYIITGVSAGSIDVTMLFILHEFAHLWYLTSAIWAFATPFSIAFVIQKYWTFGDYSDHNLHGQFLRYLFTVLLSLSLSLGILSALVELARLNYILAQIIALCVAGVFGFIMNVRNVFNQAGHASGVVIASGIFPPDIGGPATFVNNLSSRLVSRGVNLAVVTYSDFEKDEGDDVFDFYIARIPRRIPFGLRHFEYLFWLFLEMINHDLVYAQDVTATGIPAVLVKKLLDRKMIIRIGGDLLWERLAESGRTDLSMDEFYKSGSHKNKLIFWFGRIVLANCDKVFVTAKNLKDIYIKYYGVDEAKIEILYNPLPDLAGIAGSAVASRSESKQRVVLFAGRFVKYKNIDKLIDGFLEIYEDIKPAKLILIGEGPEEDGLRSKISHQGSDHVELLPKLSHKDVIRYVGSASLCVSAATTEYNPNFILEAIVLGRKVLLNEDNGLTINLPARFLFKNSYELKSKIKELLLNGVDKTIDQRIIMNLRESNSWETIVRRHIELFKSLRIK